MIQDVPPKLPDNPTRFMDQLRVLIRSRNMAYKTEQTYCHWIKRFIRFHGMQHPSALAAKEVEQFLSHLAVQRNNSVSTQRTALNAIIFLFREFLEQPLEELSFELARKPRRLPTVFTHDEARAVIGHLQGECHLVARLVYGSGLRINEALRLRVKDVDFGMQQIIVRSGKGNKDRTALLPDSLIEPLTLQMESCLAQHRKDLAQGRGCQQCSLVARDGGHGRQGVHALCARDAGGEFHGKSRDLFPIERRRIQVAGVHQGDERDAVGQGAKFAVFRCAHLEDNVGPLGCRGRVWCKGGPRLRKAVVRKACDSARSGLNCYRVAGGHQLLDGFWCSRHTGLTSSSLPQNRYFHIAGIEEKYCGAQHEFSNWRA